MLNAQIIYDSMPPFIQRIGINLYAGSIHSTRYGRTFKKYLRSLLDSQWFDQEEIYKYQNERLRKIIRHSYNTVPYYRRIMDQRGLLPADIQTISDLAKLPILEKDDIRQNYYDLLSSTVPRKNLGYGSTSGTTGSPLSVAWDRRMQTFNNAVDWRQKYWGGVKYGCRIALLLGRAIVHPGRSKPPYWQVNHIHKQLWLSAFHMGPETLPAYYNRLLRFRPDAIEGYPSSVYLLASYLVATGKTLPAKAVFVSSEPLHDFQRKEIEKAFECQVYDYYGSAERVVFATQCSKSTGLHLNFEYGISELISDDGRSIFLGQSNHSGEGSLIATSLWNTGMPLLRYRLGDTISLKGKSCPCGRSMPLINPVHTKWEDCIVRADGSVLSPSALTHPFKTIGGIAKSQIIQRTTKSVDVLIVEADSLSDKDILKLRQELSKRLGNGIEINIEKVSNIPLGPNGKFRWVINESCD